MSISKVSMSEFWEEKYASGNMPWDIGEEAPAIKDYFKRKTNSNIKNNIVVLGCGRGYDAFYIAKLGKEVWGFDFSDKAIQFCLERKDKEKIKNANFLKLNFFDLVKEEKWKGYFDYVIEHTSFCAIDPSKREDYINLISYLLKPGGELVGLFFIRPIEIGGPPFGIDLGELRKLCDKKFVETTELKKANCLHGEKLNGEEYFAVFKKQVNF